MTYNKLDKAKNMVAVANQIVEFRKESERLAQNQSVQGEVLISARSEATAAVSKAQRLTIFRQGWAICWRGPICSSRLALRRDCESAPRRLPIT